MVAHPCDHSYIPALVHIIANQREPSINPRPPRPTSYHPPHHHHHQSITASAAAKLATLSTAASKDTPIFTPPINTAITSLSSSPTSPVSTASPTGADAMFHIGQSVAFTISGLRVEGLIADMMLQDVYHVEILGTERTITVPRRDLMALPRRY